MEATTKRGVTLFVDFKIRPDSREIFLQHLTDALQKAGQEPEFLSSEVLGDPQEPNRIILIENWAQNEDWMANNFFTKQYMKDYHAAVQPLVLSESSKTMLERIGENFSKAKKGVFQTV